ncbi:MAG: DUF2997 domain-containing protein [Bradymonadales bacterium]|nr:MAG: DUF2997 domain-containing protein [Bradymonadales bacterium]
MVKKREIRIVVDPEGNTQIEVLNAEGQECLEWTRELESKLGEVAKRDLKEAYYVESSEKLHQES